MENRDETTEGILRTRRRLVTAAAACLLLTAGIGIGLNWDRWFGEEDSETQVIAVDPDAGPAEEQQEDTGEVKTGIEIPGYPSLYIGAGETEVSAILENPEGNPCYFVYELVLSDSGESLYRSGLILPGQAISGFTISRGLSAGEYDAVLRVSTYSLEDGTTPMNGADMETVLVVS